MEPFWTHPEFGTLYATKLETPIGRICWPSLQTPKPGRAFKQGEKVVDRYEATLLLPKDDSRVKAFVKETEKLAKAMAAQYNEGKKTKISIERVFQDGDTFDMEKYPYYADCVVVVARNAKQPQTIDRAGDDATPADIKGGMKVRFVITPMFTSHGISFKLELVQLVKDDNVRFGGGSKDLKAFLSNLDEEDSEDSKDENAEEADDDAAEEEEEEDIPVQAKKGKTARGKGAVSSMV